MPPANTTAAEPDATMPYSTMMSSSVHPRDLVEAREEEPPDHEEQRGC